MHLQVLRQCCGRWRGYEPVPNLLGTDSLEHNAPRPVMEASVMNASGVTGRGGRPK